MLTNLWPIHDAASETFNSHYYDELLTPDGTPSKALRGAIRRLRASPPLERTPFAHPLFWAGYRVIGFN